MTVNEYQKEALKTDAMRSRSPREIVIFDPERYNMMQRLQQGLMGLCGEAGEAIDILKKHLFQGHEFSEDVREHLAKELGDVAWYLAVSADALGYSLETILRMNVNKLRKRYPNGCFESEKSMERQPNDL